MKQIALILVAVLLLAAGPTTKPAITDLKAWAGSAPKKLLPAKGEKFAAEHRDAISAWLTESGKGRSATSVVTYRALTAPDPRIVIVDGSVPSNGMRAYGLPVDDIFYSAILPGDQHDNLKSLKGGDKIRLVGSKMKSARVILTKKNTLRFMLAFDAESVVKDGE